MIRVTEMVLLILGVLAFFDTYSERGASSRIANKIFTIALFVLLLCACALEMR